MRPYLGASRQPLDPLGVGMGSHPTGSPDSGRDRLVSERELGRDLGRDVLG